MFPNQNNKSSYRALCDENKNIPLFMQAWWMDAVCGDKKWDVLMYKKNDRIIAVWVYHFIKRFGINMILQPQLTQHNGIWIHYPENQSTCERLSLEKKIITKLEQSIKKVAKNVFSQNFSFNITNWQPFYWLGYNQTTRYTYKINNISNLDKVFNDFHSGKQKHILKAQSHLIVDFDIDPSEFFDFHVKSWKSKNEIVYYSKHFFINLYTKAKEHNQGKLIAIRDKQQNIHSALFTVWDTDTAYYLISAIEPNYRSSGASNLMIWEAIKFLSNKTRDFDFEGSMLEGVAKANEEFGAKQIPYFMIYKINPIVDILIKSINIFKKRR
jgi:hypothetical protein